MRSSLVYRVIGIAWLLSGLLILPLAVLSVAAPSALATVDGGRIQAVWEALRPPMRRFAPELWSIAGLGFGLFCLLLGSDLLALKSWACAVGAAFNLVMGLCLTVLAILLGVGLNKIDLAHLGLSERLPLLVGLMGTLAAWALVALGIQFISPRGLDILFGIVPAPSALPPVQCPTCRATLTAAGCPRCDDELRPPARPIQAKLVDLQTHREYLISLQAPTRIGRQMPGVELQIDDLSVANEHAMIEYANGHFYLHALKDLSGTFVNDLRRKVRDVEIKHNDIVMLGRRQFRFYVLQ